MPETAADRLTLMPSTRIHLFVIMTVVWLVIGPATARADQIDGHWCFTDGRSLSIRGSEIITPGGTKMLGDYDRHGFAYVVPAGEKGAGDQVLMRQQDHYTVHVWQNRPEATEQGTSEIWRRCDPRTS